MKKMKNNHSYYTGLINVLCGMFYYQRKVRAQSVATRKSQCTDAGKMRLNFIYVVVYDW